ncbi:type II toxin-antitoxin system RelE/ParE family toxin [Halomonas sp. LS-001]
MKLVYTDEAINDWKRFREFSVVHNPTAAARIKAELLNKIELLPDFPAMGALVEMARVRSASELIIVAANREDINGLIIEPIYQAIPL